MRVLLVAPVAPPSGGMALQAQQLRRLLEEDGIDAELFPSNFSFPTVFRPLERVPLVRTLMRAALICWLLAPRVKRADVVHVLAASWLYFFLVVYPAVLIGRVLGKRVVLNYRGGDAAAFFRRFGGLMAPAFRLADAVTAPSGFLAALIQERFRMPVGIVRNVLDRSLFEYRQRTMFQPRLLATRQLEKIYDIETILQAFRAVQQRYPKASLWIAGTGSEEPRLRAVVAAWDLRGVSFLGQVAHPDLPAVYRQCDIYVNASKVDNFPGSLLEASAAGLAVVTTGVGGISYIYEHGRSALLVEPGDWRGLAARVERVIECPSEAAAMTQAAEEIVRTCEWPEVRKALFEVYGFDPDVISQAAARLSGARCVAG